MGKNKIIVLISIIVLLLLLVTSFIIVMKTGYKADSQVSYMAKLIIYQPDTPGELNKPASGAELKLICSDDNMGGTKEFSGFADSDGMVSIPISNPSICMYRIFARSNHNWSQHGSVSLLRYLENPPGIEQIPTYEVDNQVDILLSSYGDLAGYYRSGYQGSYRISKWDSYIVRNPVTLDKFLTGVAPQKAKIKVDVKSVNDVFCMPDWEPGHTEDPQKFFININVMANNSDWKNAKADGWGQPTTSGIVGEKQIEINCKNYSTFDKFEIDVDYSNISKENRYYSYVNGFTLSATVVSSDPNYASVSYPFLVMERSEDNEGRTAATIEYSDMEEYLAQKPGFQGELVNPVSSGATITSDYGWRGIEQSECHRGIDYDTGLNTELYSVADGVVDFVHPAEHKGYGVHLVIKHCNNMYTFYGHLNHGGIKVVAGEKVKAGQLIGLADSTGSSTGHHLHFSVGYKSWQNYYDPLLFFNDLSGPISVIDWPGRPVRNKTKDPEKRRGLLEKDPCIKSRGWKYEI